MNAEVKVLPLPQELTAFEHKVFELLSTKPAGEFTNHKEIEIALYGQETSLGESYSNCVQVFILRMRRKGVAIETKKGRGYRLAPAVATEPFTASAFITPIEQPQS